MKQENYLEGIYGCLERIAEKEEAQERKEFVNHMYNEKTLKDETGKLFGRHLWMP